MDINELLIAGKETVALRLSNDCNAFSEFAHIRLDVCYVADHSKNNNQSIGFYDNYFGQKNQYRGLTITCQMDARNVDPYAVKIIVRQSEELTLDMAEESVRVLRPIIRKLQKISESEGSANTFEEFVVRVCRVLKVKAFYIRDGLTSENKLNNNIGLLKDVITSTIKNNQGTLGCDTQSKAA